MEKGELAGGEISFFHLGREMPPYPLLTEEIIPKNIGKANFFYLDREGREN